MKLLDKVFNYFFIMIIFIYGLLLVLDIINVLSNPNDYRVVQGFNEENLVWNSKEVLEYVLRVVVLLVFLSLLFILGLKKLKNIGNYKIWNILYYTSVIICLIIIGLGYLQWGNTGFDH
jgi:hypothetical protein